MRTGGAMLLVAVGILALWIVVTGRLDRLVLAWNTLAMPDLASPANQPGAYIPPMVPGIPPIVIMR